MPKEFWSKDGARQIEKRIVVEGRLQLLTPAHLGNGDGDEVVDLPLLVDAYDGKSPVLTGSSIAGALRSYLAGCSPQARAASVKLFGGVKGDDKGLQSPLIVEDARGTFAGIERRDGVKLEATSRTATDKALFDLHLWRAGTTFPVRVELLIHRGDDEATLRKALATALGGFDDERAPITIGARKHRGYGRATVMEWRVHEYDLMQPQQLCEWIKAGGKDLPDKPQTDLKQLSATAYTDERDVFVLDAQFTLDGSLLIRSGGGTDDIGPDMVHLRSWQVGQDKPVPILSGTSLAGALRARALKIANTIGRENAAELVNGMFGPEIKPGVKPRASRIFVEEHVIDGGEATLVQSRVSIDRFTGGARDMALFNEQPLWGKAQIKIKLRLIDPRDAEIGLLLLVLKDLWTGDLPLGGESSVGRGRLRGLSATITRQTTWEITANGDKLTVSDEQAAAMEQCVKALHRRLTGQEANHA
jgi:CRISPR/Cas system CSM-associated protein Csm3 (group 7 of RAMP superfamily)